MACSPSLNLCAVRPESVGPALRPVPRHLEANSDKLATLQNLTGVLHLSDLGRRDILGPNQESPFVSERPLQHHERFAGVALALAVFHRAT